MAGNIPAGPLVYPQPATNREYHNLNCENVPAHPLSTEIDRAMTVVDTVRAPRGGARTWPAGTVAEVIIQGGVADANKYALRSDATTGRPAFTGYTPDAVIPGFAGVGEITPAQARLLPNPDPNLTLKRSSSTSEIRRILATNTRGYVTQSFYHHYWRICSGSDENLAARLSYFLLRCEPYNVYAQLLSCIEIRERQQDYYRGKGSTVKNNKDFKDHAHEIEVIYDLLLDLRGRLRGGQPPSTLSVTFVNRRFSIDTDADLSRRITEYTTEKSRREAAAAAAAEAEARALAERQRQEAAAKRRAAEAAKPEEQKAAEKEYAKLVTKYNSDLSRWGTPESRKAKWESGYEQAERARLSGDSKPMEKFIKNNKETFDPENGKPTEPPSFEDWLAEKAAPASAAGQGGRRRTFRRKNGRRRTQKKRKTYV
jgi:hypothetical protein